MNRILTAISKLFGANSPGIALIFILHRVWRRSASAGMTRLLGAPGLYLGSGCRVLGSRCISFGRNVYAERNLWLEAVASYSSQRFQPQITIGDYVSFSDGVHISAITSIVIGSHCLFGSKSYVSDHNHGIYRGDQQSNPDEPPAQRTLGGGGPVVIEENVFIGENAVIIGPATIGRGAVIGANSVVSGVVPANTIVAGAPAKPIKLFNSKTGTWDKA